MPSRAERGISFWTIPLVALLLGVTRLHAAEESYGGLPRVEGVQVLRNPGFTVGYSDEYRVARWVVFRAASVRGRKLPPRPEGFDPDSRLEHPVYSRDYSGSHYDRGHLAPNYLIGKLFGRAAQRATFLMSNVAPQRPRLNKLVWQRLEEAEVDEVAPAAGGLWVVAGPVFDRAPRRLKKGVAIPEAFYRIWVDTRDPDPPQALAFIVPQKVCGEESLGDFVVSVDAVESRTGIDFFAALDDGLEAPLEASVRPSGFRLADWARRPARYAEDFAGQPCRLD